MCGRYAITLPPEAVRAFFRYVEQPNFPPRYNIAPTQPVPIVRIERTPLSATDRHFRLVRWGLIPAWLKDPKGGPPIINVRSESTLARPSFRAAMLRRRCLFIADAFYEWQHLPGSKKAGAGRPFLIRRADRQPMGFAGLWEPWLGADGSEIETACILTMAANASVGGIHDRMPAIIAEGDFNAWLDVENVNAEDAAELVGPMADDALEIFEIGTAINRAANDGPEVQLPIARPLPERPTPGPDEGVQGRLF
ncbi:MAG: SOS response-associated peptidase [Methylobacteriaceae bacterium]|nr:SOS response-associated peptidase [Methylobacteriaceae bacterium]MBV9703164.1 SOS response-associated peptidase [Methylobacteriaceae bacterium]